MILTDTGNFSFEELVDGIITADRGMLAKAITLSESTLDSDRLLAEALLKRILPYTGQSIRIGITGASGAGKSTFIEAFGKNLVKEGKKIGILTVDPSSQKSKGSILGDKTRMENLSQQKNVFIRPSPSGTSVGGVTSSTREAILLCEAAGFDVIIVETVGVGQSEFIVHSMIDFFLLLHLAGSGDELQGIKKGIIEMADGVIVTKADGQNLNPAKLAMVEVNHSLHILPERSSGWKPKVLLTSVVKNTGIADVWTMVKAHQQCTTKSGYFHNNRHQQMLAWFDESILNYFQVLLKDPRRFEEKENLWRAVQNGRLIPPEAARLLWGRSG